MRTTRHSAGPVHENFVCYLGTLSEKIPSPLDRCQGNAGTAVPQKAMFYETGRSTGAGKAAPLETGALQVGLQHVVDAGLVQTGSRFKRRFETWPWVDSSGRGSVEAPELALSPAPSLRHNPRASSRICFGNLFRMEDS